MSQHCIIFDLDGVLIDSWGLMQRAFRIAYSECGGVGPAPLNRFRQELGRPLQQIVERMGLSHRFIAAYERASRAHLHLSRPYEGVHKVLEDFSAGGFLLALNTGKYRHRTEEVLNRFNLTKFFKAIVTGEEVTYGKPHPESLHKIVDLLKVRVSDTFFVGDMEVDMLCAKAAGVTGVAALWGIGSREELSVTCPCLSARSIYELPPILRRECTCARSYTYQVGQLESGEII